MTNHLSFTAVAASLLLAARFVSADEPPVVATTAPRSAAEQQRMFHLPPGFEIQLVAAEPAIRKPINIAFDAKGRLFVSQSIEYPYPVKEGEPRDTVQVFTDANGDGVPDKPHTFADRLNIPIGVCPLWDGAMIYSIPQIYRFSEVAASGKAMRREPVYASFGFRDTHGMASSFNRSVDGWIYACHGFSNESKVAGKDGKATKMTSGNTYRFRIDGTHLEQWTHGQVNPFGLAFDSLGNLFSADCHTKPAYMLLRGAYYPSFGAPHDGLGYGPELLQHLHGSTGIAGIVIYAADQFPPEYRGNLFVGNPVTGRINRDFLEVHGASYKGIERPDFLTCDDPWFRPVDLRLAVDGSLYVADFYNRIIGHYEVPLNHPGRDHDRGRIWRIVYKGKGAEPAVGPGDLTRKSGSALVGLLSHPNLTVRTLATQELVDRIGRPAANLLRARLEAPASKTESLLRAHGLWVLERLGALDASTIARAAGDPDSIVRVHWAKVMAERPNWDGSQRRLVNHALKDSEPFVRRAAADAMGRHPTVDQFAPLLEAWDAIRGEDSHLLHTIRMALRDHLLAHSQTWPFPGNRLGQEHLADVSVGVPRADAGRYLLAYLEATQDFDRVADYLEHAARYIDDGKLPNVAQFALLLERRGVILQQTAARAFADGVQKRGAKRSSKILAWELRLARKSLADQGKKIVEGGLELVRDLRIGGAGREVGLHVTVKSRFPELRSTAIDALAATDPALAVRLVGSVLADTSDSLEIRRRAAVALSGLGQLPNAREALLRALPLAPKELAQPIARGLASTSEGAAAMLRLLGDHKAPLTILQDGEVQQSLRERKIAGVEEKMAKWLKELPSEDARIEELLTTRKREFHDGRATPKHGEEVFTKNCAICHQIAGKGAKVGPQLDGVGVRGIDRLLEDTLAPNRNVDQAFRATRLQMADGRALSGLVLREEGSVLILADDQGKEVRLPLKEIEKRAVSALSPMPNDVASRLPAADFRDLIGYLLEQRATKSAK